MQNIFIVLICAVFVGVLFTRVSPYMRFKSACLSGNLAESKQIFESSNIHFYVSNDAVFFEKLAASGNLEILKWLDSVYVLNKTLGSRFFTHTCMSNRSELTRWVVQELGINATSINACFQQYCMSENWEMVVWLKSRFGITKENSFELLMNTAYLFTVNNNLRMLLKLSDLFDINCFEYVYFLNKYQ